MEIARRALELGAQGTPFDRMAVVLRAPSVYRAPLEEALRRAEIPAYFASGVPTPDPSGRALLALLCCAEERLSARRFSEYLSLAQVPPPTRLARHRLRRLLSSAMSRRWARRCCRRSTRSSRAPPTTRSRSRRRSRSRSRSRA